MDGLKICKILCDMLYPVERLVVLRSLIAFCRARNNAVAASCPIRLARPAAKRGWRRLLGAHTLDDRQVRGKVASVVLVGPSHRRQGTRSILLDDHERIGRSLSATRAMGESPQGHSVRGSLENSTQRGKATL
jgi:hypothetical protein